MFGLLKMNHPELRSSRTKKLETTVDLLERRNDHRSGHTRPGLKRGAEG